MVDLGVLILAIIYTALSIAVSIAFLFLHKSLNTRGCITLSIGFGLSSLAGGSSIFYSGILPPSQTEIVHIIDVVAISLGGGWGFIALLLGLLSQREAKTGRLITTLGTFNFVMVPLAILEGTKVEVVNGRWQQTYSSAPHMVVLIVTVLFELSILAFLILKLGSESLIREVRIAAWVSTILIESVVPLVASSQIFLLPMNLYLIPLILFLLVILFLIIKHPLVFLTTDIELKALALLRQPDKEITMVLARPAFNVSELMTLIDGTEALSGLFSQTLGTGEELHTIVMTNITVCRNIGRTHIFVALTDVPSRNIEVLLRIGLLTLQNLSDSGRVSIPEVRSVLRSTFVNQHSQIQRLVLSSRENLLQAESSSGSSAGSEH